MNREQIIRIAREAGINTAGSWTESDLLNIEHFAALVAAAEREECAKVIDANIKQCSPSGYLQEVLRSNAAAIRARAAPEYKESDMSKWNGDVY